MSERESKKRMSAEMKAKNPLNKSSAKAQYSFSKA